MIVKAIPSQIDVDGTSYPCTIMKFPVNTTGLRLKIWGQKKRKLSGFGKWKMLAQLKIQMAWI